MRYDKIKGRSVSTPQYLPLEVTEEVVKLLELVIMFGLAFLRTKSFVRWFVTPQTFYNHISHLLFKELRLSTSILIISWDFIANVYAQIEAVFSFKKTLKKLVKSAILTLRLNLKILEANIAQYFMNLNTKTLMYQTISEEEHQK